MLTILFTKLYKTSLKMSTTYGNFNHIPKETYDIQNIF